MNERIEKDDFLFALEQTLKFYGKELDNMALSFWWTTCKDKPIDKLKKALVEHMKIGKYAPRPADILTIVSGMQTKSNLIESHPLTTTNCPPEIAKAWMWYICESAKGTSLEGLFAASATDEVALHEKYLHIVNHEAHKYGTPDAIADEHKLQEVWV